MSQTKNLGSPAWQQAVADIIVAESRDAVARALADAVGVLVHDDGTCLLAYRRHARPEVVHHTMSKRAAAHYLDRYLAAAYLLDPLYALALAADRPGMFRFRDRAPDRFNASAYYQAYRRRTHLVDEADAVMPIDSELTLALVIGRRRSRFSPRELARLKTAAPVIHGAMARIGTQLESITRADEIHQQLLRAFEGFGGDRLTEREREVAVLLLKGHSAKSAAREMGISPATVMVHRKHLYAKLGVSSQASLFAYFLETMTDYPN